MTSTQAPTGMGPRRLSAVLGRLKLRLLRNTLRQREGGGLILFTLTAGIAGTFIAGWVWTATPEVRASIGPVLVTVLIVGWWLAPLVLGASDETVDPRRLLPFSLPARSTATAMTTTALIGPGPLASSLPLWALALRASTPAGVIVGLFTAAATLALAVTSSRWMVTVLGARLRQRRSRDLATVTAGVAAGAGGLTLQLLLQSDRLTPQALRASADVVRWLPIGWPGDGLGRISNGEVLIPALELIATIALTALVVSRWLPALERSLTEVEEGLAPTPTSQHLLGARRGWVSPIESLNTRAAAIVAKEWRYLLRHPRYRVQVLSQATVLLIGGAPFFAAVLAGDPRAVLVGCIPGLTAGVTGSNLLGADGRALWGEWITLPTLRPLLRGRSLAFASLGIGLVIVLTMVVSLITGGWRYAPTAIAAGVGMSLAGAGIAAIASTLAPVLFPEDDNPNPFASGAPGTGCLNGIATMAGVVAGLLASAPILYGLAQSRSGGTPLVVTLVAAPAYGAVVWALATRLAGRLADKRAPELLAMMDEH